MPEFGDPTMIIPPPFLFWLVFSVFVIGISGMLLIPTAGVKYQLWRLRKDFQSGRLPIRPKPFKMRHLREIPDLREATKRG